MTWRWDLSNILDPLDVGEWFSGFRVLRVMFPHSPILNEKVWKRSRYLVSLFSFLCVEHVCFISLSRCSVREGRRRGCSCEMMKFQGKVDVPSITGGGKVQINHLISPAFSPLSWGSRARGKSIKLHKWDMTQRSLCLCAALCTYLTLALSLYNNSGQLPPRLGWTSSCEMQKHPVNNSTKIPHSYVGSILIISSQIGKCWMNYVKKYVWPWPQIDRELRGFIPSFFFFF